MEKQDWLAKKFEESRDHLKAVAYRILGSSIEAEDAVQESWLKLSRSETKGTENLGGWLTTVVSRVCLDMLRTRKTRREDPMDSHLPEQPTLGPHSPESERLWLFPRPIKRKVRLNSNRV